MVNLPGQTSLLDLVATQAPTGVACPLAFEEAVNVYCRAADKAMALRAEKSFLMYEKEPVPAGLTDRIAKAETASAQALAAAEALQTEWRSRVQA
jgi:hypothetical protein